MQLGRARRELAAVDRPGVEVQDLDQLEAMLGELALLVVARDVVVQERVVMRGVVDDRVVGPAALEAAQAAVVGEALREAHDPGGDAAHPAVA